MLLIQRVTADPLQSQTLVLDDGTTFAIEMYYRQSQQGWFFNSIVYGDFEVQGIRITNNVNMLNQFRNLIPFGLACISTDNREPSLQEDFLSGASKLYVLTSAEVAEFASYLNG